MLGAGSIGGVDIGRFRPNAKARVEARANLGYDDEDVVFIYLGRLNPDKGTDTLIEAFSRLDISEPAMLLLVGPDEGATVQYIRDSFPRVRKSCR